ncbi:endonuclease toxin domain-containing protein [Catellatospora vulcania]|uniref:endonuclease toxin domain-containing protein n=1 Tax=Catellatospora vulcania TaxID=1460450 RepID=UPI0012D3FDF4|nr:hypothetical protein [Catellatospora vulcania]
MIAGDSPVLVHNCDPEIQDLGSITGAGQTNLWDLKVRDRGLAFEEHLGMSNLPDGFKTFDHLEADSGIGISLKTVDTRRASTQTGTGLYNRLKGFIDDTANYNGDHRHPGVAPANWMEHRVLYVVLHSDPLTKGQLSQLARLQNDGALKGITVLFGASSG